MLLNNNRALMDSFCYVKQNDTYMLFKEEMTISVLIVEQLNLA